METPEPISEYIVLRFLKVCLTVFSIISPLTNGVPTPAIAMSKRIPIINFFIPAPWAPYADYGSSMLWFFFNDGLADSSVYSV
jgi:hypothetical protein